MRLNFVVVETSHDLKNSNSVVGEEHVQRILCNYKGSTSKRIHMIFSIPELSHFSSKEELFQMLVLEIRTTVAFGVVYTNEML